MSRCRPRARVAAVGFAALGLALVACASARGPAHEPLRIGAVEAADPRQAASVRLVETAIEAEIDGDPERALSLYERALRVDPGNPHAFLALARHHLERGDAARALDHLDQAELLYDAPMFEAARPHLLGLRGAVFVRMGQVEPGEALLATARRQAPEVWADGWLSAEELR